MTFASTMALCPQDALASRYEAGIDDKISSATRVPLAEPQTIRNEKYSVRVGRDGAMEIEIGKDVYRFRSAYSYAGEQRIGHNVLSESVGESEGGWKPAVNRQSDSRIQLDAAGSHYTLRRRIVLDGERVHVEDTLTNVGNEPVGIIVEHVLLGPVACAMFCYPAVTFPASHRSRRTRRSSYRSSSAAWACWPRTISSAFSSWPPTTSITPASR